MTMAYLRSEAYFIGLPSARETKDVEELSVTLKERPFDFTPHLIFDDSATYRNTQATLDDISQLPHDACVLIYITGEVVSNTHSEHFITLFDTTEDSLGDTALSFNRIFQLPHQVRAKHITFLFNVAIELEHFQPFLDVGYPEQPDQTAYQVVMRDKNSTVSLAISLNNALQIMKNEKCVTLTSVTYGMEGIFPTFNLYIKGSGMGDLIFTDG
jgi:hypothetical protein